MLAIFLLLTSLCAVEPSIIPKRKGPQFLNEEGYLLLPAPYSLPGIGEGIAYFTSFNNYLGNADIFASKVEGDVDGYFLGLWDLHLIKNRLFFDLTFHDMNKVGMSNYSSRGINSLSDDYTVLEFDKNRDSSLKTTLSFFQRRLEFIGQYSKSENRLSAIKSSGGALIESLTDGKSTTTHQRSFAVVMDLTDHRQNPTKGFRTEIKYRQSEPASDFDPDYYTLNYNFTGYLPVGRQSTVALNYFKSDAIVTREGETDKLLIAQELGFGCGGSCSESIQAIINNKYQENRLGNARSLGGAYRLRAYPDGRFTGAHSETVGLEFRWNLSAERKPFNLYFMKDIRTGVQFALFHEIGTVADERSDLWKERRSASGMGTRFVMGSGVIYRFDYAWADEGSEISIMIDYPWEGDFD